MTTSVEKHSTETTKSNRIDNLYLTSNSHVDPEGLISRYVEYEFYRFRQDQHFAINGNILDRLKILHWYLSAYAPHRKLPVPISNAQIKFLNSPILMLGFGIEISIAAYSFITNEWGGTRDLRNEEILREALFWWCFEQAPKLAPGGELITPAQVRMLTYAEPHDIGVPFPLNWFVRRLYGTDPTLAKLDLQGATDRATLICILMLRCASQPALAYFLPRPAVAELLAVPVRGGTSSFDRVLALALGSDEAPNAAQAAELRTLLARKLALHGLSLETLSRQPVPEQPGVGIPFVQDPKIRPGFDPGVAVIGPTRAASGLGQATRLSVDVLAQAGRTPAVVDFGLDNPAPVGFETFNLAKPLRTPRRINLLHLNAESIPLAFAYLDKRILEHSYNIGYFFWELDQIPKCHALALDLVDEIWVSSEYNREIYARNTRVPVHNVGMAVEPLPEASRVARRDFGLPDETFVFLATFDSFSFIERKNPLGVLRAFQTAFPVDGEARVALVLKTQNRTRVGDPHQLRVWQAIDDIVASDPRIRILDQTLGYADLLGFKQLCDAYVSLHRSEGWGFGMIEAMQLKLPVITTAYSGNMEFCSPETAFLVDYALVSPMPAEYIFVERGSRWAEPCVASAVAAMRAVVEAPDQARARAEAGYRRVRDAFSLAAIARRYEARLIAIEASLAR